jgi:hypothetical protein
MGLVDVPRTDEFAIFQVQKKKFCKASMEANVTSKRPDTTEGE